MRGRPWSWITGRPRLADAVVVAINLAIGAGALVADYIRGSFALGAAAFVVLEALPLWWRRRFPVLVLVIIVLGDITRWTLHLSADPSGPAVVFAVYAVSVYGSPRARLVVAGVAIALVVFAVGLLLLGSFPTSRDVIPDGALSLAGSHRVAPRPGGAVRLSSWRRRRRGASATEAEDGDPEAGRLGALAHIAAVVCARAQAARKQCIHAIAGWKPMGISARRGRICRRGFVPS